MILQASWVLSSRNLSWESCSGCVRVDRVDDDAFYVMNCKRDMGREISMRWWEERRILDTHSRVLDNPASKYTVCAYQ